MQSQRGGSLDDDVCSARDSQKTRYPLAMSNGTSRRWMGRGPRRGSNGGCRLPGRVCAFVSACLVKAVVEGSQKGSVWQPST